MLNRPCPRVRRAGMRSRTSTLISGSTPGVQGGVSQAGRVGRAERAAAEKADQAENPEPRAEVADNAQ